MKNTHRFEQSLFDKAFYHLCQLVHLKKLLVTGMLVSFVVAASFAQQKPRLLSRYDSCHVQPLEQQEQLSLQAAGTAPMVRVAYVIPSNRSAQPNGVANLQHAMKIGQQFFKEQMEQNGFGPKTFMFETESDGVTPLINVVHVSETDEYLRGDLWNRAQTAAGNAGISLWAPGEVWVVIPETYVMFADGSGVGGVALGAGFGSGNFGGVAMIGSNALPLFNPSMITDDTPYDGKVLPELGPHPMKQDVTFAWFEGTTFSSVASSWLGALWHETGHAFGLGHDFRNDNNFHGNLMGNGLRGIRGTLFPEKYPQDYTRLEYWTALFLNVNHFFNSDKIVTNSPTVSHQIPGSVIPQQGLVQLAFQASDPDGLSFAYLVFGGDMAAEMLLEGTSANPTFAVPYFRQGDINRYIIFTVDNQGNKTNTDVEFTVPGGNNQAPFPFIKITPPVPGENQPIVLDATQSSDVDDDQSSLLVAWDVNNDGQFDTDPSTNKTLQHHYQNPGNYLIRVKVTDPEGAQTVSTPVSVKIPGPPKIVCQGDVTLSSQADVDAFSCSEVTGNLTISGTDITNLISLSSLSNVGRITISDNPNLETIDLPNLNIGSISTGSLSISNNGNLKSISGFNNVQHVNSINIERNPKLLSISGFNSLRNVSNEFVIAQNDALTSLPDFDALATAHNLRIVNNQKLLALEGFPSLTSVIGEFQISNNESLKAVTGFNKLRYISGLSRLVLNSALLIENNASLESLVGLSSLKYITAPLLGGSVPPIPGNVTVNVTGNQNLSMCCVLRPLLYELVSVERYEFVYTINISGNGGGCTQEDILNCERICDGDVTLTSQAEVDAFNCTEVKGNVTISGNDITNLNNLSLLRRVQGSLTISENPNLEAIDLPALDTLTGGLNIENNSGLLTVTGFSSLIYAGSISIGGNPKLVSISGFDHLQYVSLLQDAGGLPYGGFGIGSNDALTNIQGFGALRHTGNFRIGSNRSLLALDGFPALESVTGAFQISNNESLKTINGFNKFSSIGGIPRVLTTVSLLIQNNVSLESLDGLSSLKYIYAPLQGGAVPPIPGTVTVNVTGNQNLSMCCVLRPLLYELVSVERYEFVYTINISENGGGCTQEDILNCEICDGDVTLTSQAEVDAFNCTEVKGNVTISGNDITNLNALSSLRKVGGDISISDNPNLETIDLPDLHIGDISVRSLSISNNANLKSISGFNNTFLVSSLFIGGNPKLESISGFDSLKQALPDFGGDGFVIGQNDALTNLAAFGALKTTGNFRIGNNAKLLVLDGFPSLTHVIGEFQISNNESLKTINGFNKLMSISGVPRMVFNSALLIENNASLETLEGLSSLKFISAPVNNSVFPPAPGTVTVNIRGNPKLTQCCTLRPLLDALISGGASSQFMRIDISGNGGGCTYEDILNCEKICAGDITLTSQAEVDAFNCTKVTGNLTVTGADITNLYGLSSLREVYGHLRIENTNVTSLDGLSLLDSIGRALLVTNNPSLNILVLSCSVHEGIEISYNDNLSEIAGFNTLKKLGWLGIQNNPKLTSVAGFNSVETIQTLSADPFVPTGIGISNNISLTTIPDFQMLSKVGSIRINGNNQLSSLDGFSNVSRIAGVLTISDNSSLKVINAFENLVSIVGISRHIPRGGLIIENNALLEGFPGFSSLKEITSDQSADFSIINNASLKNIDGLSSLTTFFALHADKTLSIRNNAVLENIDSLSSIVDVVQGEGDTYINLTGNPMLTRCCGLKPLLDAISYYDPLSLHIDISQNGGGCTVNDVLACGLQNVLNFNLINHKTNAVIQNFQNEITIDLSDPKFSHLMLQANTAPQQVGSVEFIFDEHLRHTENKFPYEFILPALKPGSHTVRTEVYSKANRQGDKGIGRTATLTVVNSAAVISFDVVNTSGGFIKRLQGGDRININDPAFKSFSIRANTAPDHVSYVKFWLNHKFVRTENVAPYALTGDINGSYNPWDAKPGDYTLVAIPYIKVGREEREGKALKIHFTIEKESVLAVVSFDVVNSRGQFLMRLNDGDRINVSDPKYKAFNIVANTRGTVGSVSFWLNHQYQRTENVAPYTLAGDQFGYFNTWQPAIGHYNISAIPYSGSQAKGANGKKLSIHFKVVNEKSHIARFGEDSADGQGPSVYLYPVPVANELHVRIDDLSGGDPQITIRSIHGLIVYQGSYSKSQQINASQLPGGLYYLQIRGDVGFQKVVKFIKK